MALDPVTAKIAKSALSAATKPSIDFLRRQIARRDAPFADLATLRGADRELDEAITVLRGGSGLPSALVARLKGIASDRPDSFANAEARQFIDDARVAALVKSGARRTLRDEAIDEERLRAREIHTELFGEDGIYGETLIEDAVAFATLTLLAHLTPADRQTIELLVDIREEMRAGFAQVSGELDAMRAGWDGAHLDAAPFDDVVRAEIRKLRRQRMIASEDLPDRAVALGVKVDTGLRLATPEVRAEAYREAAVALIRGDRASEAPPWIAKAEALGADVTCEHVRIAMSQQDFDRALRLLRDRDDALSKGLLLDAIARRDGDEAAVAHFEAHFRPQDLTGHVLQVMSTRLLLSGSVGDARALLANATDDQIAENPVILYIRARHSLCQAVAPDIAERLMEHEGMLPRRSDLHDDLEGRRRLASAQADLQRLVPGLPDLCSSGFATMVDINLTALRLCAPDQAEREVARTEFIARLEDPAQTAELAPLAKLYGIDVDWSVLKAKLAEAETLGGYDDIQLRAAFTIVMEDGDPHAVATFVHRHRERLELFSTGKSVVAIEIEALAKSGRIDEARALLAAESTLLGEETTAFLETTFAELTGDDTTQARLEQFTQSGSTHDLEVLIEVMGPRADPRVGDYLIELWRRRRQLRDAQRACDTLLSVGDERKVENFLDEIDDEARADPLLRTHLAWARYRQGRLADAEIELSGLSDMGVDDHNTRHLTVLLMIETGRWLELEPYVRRQLAMREDRSSSELIATARIARAIGSTTMDLLLAATGKDVSDARIAIQAYSIATEAGLDRRTEVGEWLGIAIADQEASGLTAKTDMNEIIEMVRGSRERADQIGGMINTAALPMFLGMNAMGGTQSAFVIRQMPHNAAETDSRRRSVIPLFAGNRLLRPDVRPKSISLDPLSILVLGRLGMMDVVIDAFEDVVLPSGTLHSFFEDRGKAAHSQPSRVEQARHIRDTIASGQLIVEDLATVATAQVDAEFAGFFAAAEERDGYIVDTAPLRPPGEFEATTDPAPYAHRLLSPSGLVTAMHASGLISRAVASAAEAVVAGAGGTFPSEPALYRGKPFFLSYLATQYLSDAKLLPTLKAFSGQIVTSKEAVRLIDQEIETGAAADEVRAGIEEVRATLARAIAEGRARIGPARRMKDEADHGIKAQDQAIRMSPVMSVLRDAGGIDAFVCDDRAMNKYLETTDRTGHTVTFLTTADLLVILRHMEVIDDAALDAARETLRRSGIGMMPVDPDEMRRATLTSNWKFGPSAELRSIRDSIHLPLARKVVQMPEERPWFRMVSLSIAFAIRAAWTDIADDTEAETAANYLFDLLPDPYAWSEGDLSPDRELWLIELTRTSIWGFAAMFDLPEGRVEPYRQWFARRIEPSLGRRDPGATEAVARLLYSSMTAPMEIDENDDS